MQEGREESRMSLRRDIQEKKRQPKDDVGGGKEVGSFQKDGVSFWIIPDWF